MAPEVRNFAITNNMGAQPPPAGPGPDQETPAQTRAHRAKVVIGPVAILWDMENCPVPSDVASEEVAVNILMALRLHPAVQGAVTLFSAYGDFNLFPRKIREGCQRTGVSLIDVPHGRKDAADKAILVDMFLFVLDNPAPATVLLVSGDVDFSQALHKLGQRGYNIILAVPSGQGVSSALSNAGRFVWDWPSLARGEGLVAAKVFVPRLEDKGNDIPVGSACKSAYEDSCDETYDKPQPQGLQPVLNSQDKSSRLALRMTMAQSLASDKVGGCGSILTGEPEYASSPHTPPSLRQELSVPSCCNSRLVQIPCGESLPFPRHQTETGECTSPGLASNASFVEPGDIEGLKKQLAKLLARHGGRLKFMSVPPEYFRVYKRPLYLAEYGEQKLANLLRKMEDVVRITGHGLNRILHLTKKGIELSRKHKGRERIGAVLQDSDYCEDEPVGSEMPDLANHSSSVDMQSRSDIVQDLSIRLQAYSLSSPAVEMSLEEETSLEPVSKPAEADVADVTSEVAAVAAEYAADMNLHFFKEELQELLVSCGCSILISSFQDLYQQRYAKQLDFCAFGVQKLESLFEKLVDVVTLDEVEISPGKVGKVLMAKARV